MDCIEISVIENGVRFNLIDVMFNWNKCLYKFVFFNKVYL